MVPTVSWNSSGPATIGPADVHCPVPGEREAAARSASAMTSQRLWAAPMVEALSARIVANAQNRKRVTKCVGSIGTPAAFIRKQLSKGQCRAHVFAPRNHSDHRPVDHNLRRVFSRDV